MPILEDLREAVRADGRTHREIARMADIHFTSLSRFLAGGGLSAEHLEKLAFALHFSVKLVPRPPRGK